MPVIKLDLFGNRSKSLKGVGRAFIAIIAIIILDFIWFAIRSDNCNPFNGDLLDWIQLLISWLVLCSVIAIQLPSSILSAVLYGLVIGAVVGFVVSPCRTDIDLGNYVLNIVQGMTTCVIVSIITFLVSRVFKWYPKKINQ